MKNYKKLAVVAAMLFSAQAVMATDITGVAGVNGVFNIDPTAINGDVGIRHFKNFNLSAGDIANLIYKYGVKDISTFANLVDSKININGIVNTVRDGKFHNGHAVFISPNGMVVGASGVLNVGSLTVMTPTEDRYNTIIKNPTSFEMAKIQNKSNADVQIDGQVFSRGDVEITGKNVAIGGDIYNGKSVDIVAKTDADVKSLVFNSLVNYDAAMASNKALDVVDGKVVIRTGAVDGKIDISGAVVNANKGDLLVQNNSRSSSIDVSGDIENLNGGDLYLHNRGESLDVSGTVLGKDGHVVIKNANGGVRLDSSSEVTSKNGDLRIINHGEDGLISSGSLNAEGETALVKNTKGNLLVGGNVNFNNSLAKQIINNAVDNSSTLVDADITTSGDAVLYVKSTADGGLVLNADIKNGANDSTIINNQKGSLIVGGNIDSSKDVSLANTGNHLSVTNGATVSGKGKVVLKNSGTGNTNVLGTVKNDGDVISIISQNGDVEISGVVENSGNIGIKARGDGFTVKTGARIQSTKGDVLVQNKGAEGMYLYGDVLTKNKLSVVNNKGILGVYGTLDADSVNVANLNKGNEALVMGGDLKGKVVNVQNKANGGIDYAGNINASDSTIMINEAGDMKIAGAINSDKDVSLQSAGTGKLNITSDGSVSGKGAVVVYNKADGGMVIDGTVSNNGEVISITNKKGNLVIGGKVHSVKGDLGIVNKDQGNALITRSTAVIKNDNGKTNVINAGEGGMDLGGAYTTAGELNIINDNGEGYVRADIDAGKLNTFSRKLSKGLTFLTGPAQDIDSPILSEEDDVENPYEGGSLEDVMTPDAE